MKCVSRIKGVFEKGYINQWSLEKFIIAEVLPTSPYTYKLTDVAEEPIDGVFYEEELKKTEPDKTILIDKVLKSRKKNGRKQYYVSYLGYPPKFNRWLNEVDLIG